MPNCEMEIEFYRPGREFRPGETIQGWVRLRVDRPVFCRQLTVTGYWCTRGRGNSVRKNYFHTTLYRGRWRPNSPYEYPFEFVAPDRPLSYHGQNLQLEHYVQAQADTPWPGETGCVETFGLLPAPSSGGLPVSSASQASTISVSRLAFWLAALLLVASFALAPATGGASLWGLLAVALTAAVVSLQSIYAARLGEVDIVMSRDFGAPGERLPFEIKINPIRKISVQEISVALQSTEVVIAKPDESRHGILRRRSHRHVLHLSSQRLAPSAVLNEGQEHVYRGTLDIPANAACSIDLPENQVIWQASFRIVMPWAGARLHRRIVEIVASNIEPPPNPAYIPVSASALEQVMCRLRQSSDGRNDAHAIVVDESTKVFEIHVTIDKITEANPVLGDAEYRNGRQMFARMRNLPEELVVIQIPEHYNDRVDKTRPGEHWSGHVTLVRWTPTGRSEFVAI